MKKKTKRTPKTADLNRHIRIAALSLSENASITDLATKAKVSHQAIRKAIRLGRFSVGLASALELAVGRDHLKREDLCPDLAE